MSKITRSGESFLDFKKRSKTADFPTSFCHYIQSFGETYFWEKGNFHVITKAHHAREILTSDAFSADRSTFFISRMPKLDLSLIQDFFGVVSKMMVMSDDQAHAKRRNLAAHGFEDQVLERFSAKLLSTVKLLLEQIKDKKDFNLKYHNATIYRALAVNAFLQDSNPNALERKTLLTAARRASAKIKKEHSAYYNQYRKEYIHLYLGIRAIMRQSIQ